MVDIGRSEGRGAQAPVVEHGRRPFQFLAEVQRLKLPRITNLDTYKVNGLVMWLADLPAHDTVSMACRESHSESPDEVLTVKRVIVTPLLAFPFGDRGRAETVFEHEPHERVNRYFSRGQFRDVHRFGIVERGEPVDHRCNAGFEAGELSAAVKAIRRWDRMPSARSSYGV